MFMFKNNIIYRKKKCKLERKRVCKNNNAVKINHIFNMINEVKILYLCFIDVLLKCLQHAKVEDR